MLTNRSMILDSAAVLALVAVGYSVASAPAPVAGDKACAAACAGKCDPAQCAERCGREGCDPAQCEQHCGKAGKGCDPAQCNPEECRKACERACAGQCGGHQGQRAGGCHGQRGGCARMCYPGDFAQQYSVADVKLAEAK